MAEPLRATARTYGVGPRSPPKSTPVQRNVETASIAAVDDCDSAYGEPEPPASRAAKRSQREGPSRRTARPDGAKARRGSRERLAVSFHRDDKVGERATDVPAHIVVAVSPSSTSVAASQVAIIVVPADRQIGRRLSAPQAHRAVGMSVVPGRETTRSRTASLCPSRSTPTAADATSTVRSRITTRSPRGARMVPAMWPGNSTPRSRTAPAISTRVSPMTIATSTSSARMAGSRSGPPRSMSRTEAGCWNRRHSVGWSLPATRLQPPHVHFAAKRAWPQGQTNPSRGRERLRRRVDGREPHVLERGRQRQQAVAQARGLQVESRRRAQLSNQMSQDEGSHRSGVRCDQDDRNDCEKRETIRGCARAIGSRKNAGSLARESQLYGRVLDAKGFRVGRFSTRPSLTARPCSRTTQRIRLVSDRLSRTNRSTGRLRRRSGRPPGLAGGCCRSCTR